MTQADRVHSTPRTDSSLPRRLSERERDPRDVLTELFREELLPDPDLMADLVIARLGSKGFVIWPYEAPKPPRTA